MTPEQFTDLFSTKLQELEPTLSVDKKEALHLETKNADGKVHNVFLDNAYFDYEKETDELESVILRHLNALKETLNHKEAPLNSSSIVPVIKDVGYIREIKLSLGDKEVPKEKLNIMYEEYNDDLVVLYAHDSPQNIKYFGQEDLEATGIKKEDLRELSVKNLKSILPKIELHGSDGFYMMTAGGDYEASLLLFDSIWSGTQIRVEGDYVIAIPSRDLLLITGSKNSEGLEKLQKLATEAVQENSYHLTDQLFVYQRGQFREFKN